MKTFRQLLKEEHGNNRLAAEFFQKCRQSATYTHYCHLTTDSYAQHVAFGEYYDGIIPLMDSFMETFIGEFGSIDFIEESASYPFKVTIDDVEDWIETNRSMLTDCTELQNILDEIVQLCKTIKYKLNNLH